MTRWTLEVKYNSEADEHYLEFPDNLMEQVGWKVGDTVLWSQNEDGSWILTKKGQVETTSDQTTNAPSNGTTS